MTVCSMHFGWLGIVQYTVADLFEDWCIGVLFGMITCGVVCFKDGDSESVHDFQSSAWSMTDANLRIDRQIDRQTGT